VEREEGGEEEEGEGGFTGVAEMREEIRWRKG